MAYTVDDKGNLVPVTGIVPSNVIEKEFTLAQSMGGAREGERVMLAVTPADTSQTTELETYMGGYTQGGFAADLVSRIVPVDKEVFKRRNYSHLNTFAPVEDRVGRSGAINQIEADTELVTDKTEEHALAAFIPYAAEQDATGTYNVRVTHLNMIRQKLDLNREIRIFDKASATASWNAANYATITTNYRWNTGTSKNCLADVYARLNASWQPVRAIVMSQLVSQYFLADASVKAHVELRQGSGPKSNLIVESEMPGVQQFTIPGLPPFYVVDTKKFVGGAMAPILADDVLLLSTPTVLAGGDTMASLLSFRYRGRSGVGYTVNEYVPYGRGLNGGTMLEAGFADADVMVSGRAGGLIKSVLTGT